MPDPQIVILGASARAACFSARRSCYSPYWIDSYGDFDLTENFPGVCVSADRYPEALVGLVVNSPEVPFLYTGALENHLSVLEELESLRPLFGNSAKVCRAVCDPFFVSACLQKAGLKSPKISKLNGDGILDESDWLMKSIGNTGGKGIAHYRNKGMAQAGSYYLQEFMRGESRAGIFVGDGKSASLLGVTRQLVGEDFLNAGEFSYCGSVGPLSLDTHEKDSWQNIGQSIAREFGLKGLFGVDAIIYANDVYPIEINPRYTASVEVLEFAQELSVIEMHCRACEGQLPTFKLPVNEKMMGKAYLFAAQDLLCPKDLKEIYAPEEVLPLTADIPQAATHIPRGHPIMTIFARGDSQKEVIQLLKYKAELLYSKFDVV